MKEELRVPRAAKTDNKLEKKTGSSPVSYPTETLLHSKALSEYQRDFARALLTRPEYTLEEAKAELERFFGKEGKR